MEQIRDYRVVIPSDATENELRAAAFIRENVRLVTGRAIPLVRDTEAPVPLEIAVGRTSREALDGISITRYRDSALGGVWEYSVKKVGARLYVTGHGLPPAEEAPYTSAYRTLDDGQIGTVMAAYHFVERILGYEFLYGAYEPFPENDALEMPADYDYSFTRARMKAELPPLYDGPAIYVLQCSDELHWNMGSIILKTRSGRLVVIDGGHEGETDRMLGLLRHLSGESVPHVSAWLFSHMHRDHYGVYAELCEKECYRGAVTVGDVYCNFLTDEFYTTLARERSARFAAVRREILASGAITGATVHTVERGDVFEIDGLRFDVLHAPSLADAARMNMNDSSVVYKMTVEGGQTWMLLGDAEFVCNNSLLENAREQLPSDVVQVGHHGCGNVSYACYEAIGARAYVWQVGEKFWYSDGGEGLNTHNTGVIRTRAYMMRQNPKRENVHVVMDGILASPLPMEIR